MKCRFAFAILLLALAALAWGQGQEQTKADQAKVDKAAAYYFYAIAHDYAVKAGRSVEKHQEYVDKAIENYRRAIKADPEASRPAEELAEISNMGRLRVQGYPLPLYKSPPR